MKTTVCKRCGKLVRYDEERQMWFQPGQPGTQGRWCNPTSDVVWPKPHKPNFSRIREDSK